MFSKKIIKKITKKTKFNNCIDNRLNIYYIKDISKFGIDLSKTIIVDNMAQNFKLQKDNGILISSFWGEDFKDDSLYFLGKILVNISKEMIENKYQIDIRELILKYKEDILSHVSLKWIYTVEYLFIYINFVNINIIFLI